MLTTVEIHDRREIGWIEIERFTERLERSIPVRIPIALQAVTEIIQDFHDVRERFIRMVVEKFNHPDRLCLPLDDDAIHFTAAIRPAKLLECELAD